MNRCPQCGSEGCGAYRCRFSCITHTLFRTNQYADAMIRRDKERPQWLRDLLTGARDIPVGH